LKRFRAIHAALSENRFGAHPLLMDNVAVEFSDFELLASYASARDPQAFGQLVHRHIDFVYASAVRQLGDRHLAEDVVQAVFLLLARKAAKIKPGTFVKGWLFNATRYVASNTRRAEIRRQLHEREAATKRCESASNETGEVVSPHLDDALAALGAKDRTAVLMRYFEQMPMLAVGRAMGISEGAAIKRVSRAVQRLRSILASRGIEVAGDAMAGMLGMGLVEKAPAHLVVAASEMGTKAAAAHVALAGVLGKTASRGMPRTKLSIVIAKFVLAAACVATAATMAVEKTHPPALKRAVILADVAPVPTTQPGDADYQACQDVLQSIVDACDNEDPSAVNAQLYFGPDADPELVRLEPAALNLSIIAYRIQKDAVAKFGAHALAIRYYSGSLVGALDELLGRIGPKDYNLVGDTLVMHPGAPFFAHPDAWPKAPIYFKKVGPDWKVDAGRTLKVVYNVRLKVSTMGETREQTAAAFIKETTDACTAIAADVEQNNITSAADLQKRLDGVVIGMSFKYRDFSGNIYPKETTIPGGNP
jgi:RNA polymerase sigma factor (sigma-70 family)